MPALRPAAYAAPRAVVSIILGLITGIDNMSAWKAMSGAEFVRPPSTLSTLSFIPLSASTASKMSFAWKAVASSTALHI